ncbi:pilus assembly protein TadG-related protein [Roseibium sp.]|uniref:pilus assembly protein TadG-related protein n=1 Tax=Roseibium sp. TaxID=1936156 RepID=UPI003D12EBCA
MIKALLQAFASDRRGTIATFTALVMPIVVGGFALGAEASYWYFTERKLQNSADVAAYAAAAQLRMSKNRTDLNNVALAAAVSTGYNTSFGTITTTWPATTGTYAGDTNAVEITVREDIPRLFTSLFSKGDVPIAGRAVAKIAKGNPACILSLDQRASGAVTITGSANVTLEGCNVHANSTSNNAVDVSGSAKVSTPCISSVGEVSATSGLTMSKCKAPIEYADVADDPFANLPAPSTNIPCEPQTVFGGGASSTYTISGGRYCGGLSIRRTVTMNPGVYIVDGGTFELTSTAKLSGSQVMIYLTNGARVKFAGTADVQLSAPTSGIYKGILVFVDRTDPEVTHIFNGNSASAFNGAIYAPSGHVQIAGTSSVGGGCTQVVANTIDITGSAGLGNNCLALGYNEITNEQLVQLVE